jgi:hypothetical protein
MECSGREIAVATLHGKQRILARPFRQGLGLRLVHASTVDTDQFGSFCGTQLRRSDAVLTAQRKAEAAMDALGLDLGIASEGSFGPHPAVPMVAVGIECLVIVDRLSGRVVVEQAISRRTNFSAMAVSTMAAAQGWLAEVGFPSHAVMVRPQQHPNVDVIPWMAKGVTDSEQLRDLIQRSAAESPAGMAWLETDMRAHCNPTRMASIRKLAFVLVRRMREPCPTCHAPGFGLVDTVAGLRCSGCGFPSHLVLKEIFGCDVCGHQDQRPRKDGVTHADPTYCDICNP